MYDRGREGNKKNNDLQSINEFYMYNTMMVAYIMCQYFTMKWQIDP